MMSGVRCQPGPEVARRADRAVARRGVNALPESFVFELAPRIRGNALLPSLVPTDIVMKSLRPTADDLLRLEEALQIPAGRLGRSMDLGSAIL